MGTEFLDNRGLVCGFQFTAGQAASSVSLTDLDPTVAPTAPVWLNFNANDTRARDWIANCLWLDTEARDQLLTKDPRVHLDAIGRGIAGSVSDLYADDPDTYGVFHLACNEACLITTRRHPLLSGQLLRQALIDGLVVASTLAALHRLLRYVVANSEHSVREYGDRIDNAEDAVFAGELEQNHLGQYRRAMARARRQVFANRHALTKVSAILPSAWDPGAVRELDRLAAALTETAQDLELVEERARLVIEEIDSRLAARTNRNLYFVSLAAAVFLPITLISGIFGMNVAGLPWTEDELGFINTIALMVIAVVVAFGLIRWRRML